MKLSDKAIGHLAHPDNRNSRLKLAIKLGFGEAWIKAVIKENKDNGPLTTMAAMQVIREETGLMDSEILEAEPVPAIG